MNDHPPANGSRSTDPYARLRLVALIAAIAGVVVLAAGAFVFSYQGIHELARSSGVSAGLARFYPVIFDAMLVVACAAVLSLRGAGWWRRGYSWLTALVLLAALALADALHATGTHIPRRPSAATVAVLPWVLLLLAFSLLLSMLRQFRHARVALAEREAARAMASADEPHPAGTGEPRRAGAGEPRAAGGSAPACPVPPAPVAPIAAAAPMAPAVPPAPQAPRSGAEPGRAAADAPALASDGKVQVIPRRMGQPPAAPGRPATTGPGADAATPPAGSAGPAADHAATARPADGASHPGQNGTTRTAGGERSETPAGPRGAEIPPPAGEQPAAEPSPAEPSPRGTG